ncbi:CHAT domain-containing tetratricopeptide repeat protein [Microcoleus sp. OTE_8_concoct_300]|uniref:CHAT domain-containing tetratricopeptide repeat protein n=1 Tax=Microcoleus sp. OTE_8_concoct_300 TaxID=2964710 RepID=UPI00403F6C6E
MGNAWLQQGIQKFNSGQAETALKNLQEAENIFRRSGNSQGEGTALINAGLVYIYLQNTTRGIDSFKRSLAIARQISDSELENISQKALSLFEGKNSQEAAALVRLLNLFQSQSESENNSEKTKAERLYQQGIQQYYRGQFSEALQYFQQALNGFQKIGDRLMEADTLNNIGIIYTNTSKFTEAINYLESSLNISKKVNDYIRQGRALFNLGGVYLQQNNYQKALTIYQQVLDLSKATKSRDLEGMVLNNIGEVYRRTNQHKKTEKFYQTALAIARETRNRSLEGNVLNNIGIVAFELQRHQEALKLYQAALNIAIELGNQGEKAKILNNIAANYKQQGKYKEALEYLEQALINAQKINSKILTSSIFRTRGEVYQIQRQYKQALADFRQALTIAKEIENSSLEADILANIAGIYYKLSQYQEALKYYEEALSLAVKIESYGNSLGDRNLKRRMLNDRALLHIEIGQYQEALEAYKEILTIIDNAPDSYILQKNLATNLTNIAILIGNLANNLKAEELDNHSLNLQISSREVFNLSLEAYNSALAIFKTIEYPIGQGRVLNGIGNLYSKMNEYKTTLNFYQQALDVAVKIDERELEGIVLNNIGLAYQQQGQYQKALEFYQQSLVLARKIGDRALEGNTLSNMGSALLKIGHLKEAENSLRQAMNVYESLRVELEDKEKISLIDLQTAVYRNLQRSLIAQNETIAALEISERGRARAFVELLTQNLSLRSDNLLDIPHITVQQITEITQKQNATLVEYSIVSPEEIYIWVIQKNGKITVRHSQLKSLIPDISLSAFVRKSRESIVKEGAVANNRPASRITGNNNQISSTINQLAPGDLVRLNDDLPYYPAREVISIDRQNGMLTIKLPNSDPIQRPIADVVKKVEFQNIHNQELQTLHQLLIEPIADLLPKDPESRVIFIPQGELFLVPFPALQDANGKFLIEKHTILTAPSIQVLDSTRQIRQRVTSSATDVLVVGNPVMPKIASIPGKPPQNLSPLPNAEIEANNIAKQFTTSALIGSQATKANILPMLPQAKIIHLATHGIFDNLRGLGSAIALTPSGSDDGWLTAEEIFNLKLNAELVVLSACNTGQGRITQDGIIGLSRSLISAGTPSVIVSLWSVPDAPTAPLMVEFYRQWQEKKLNKAQALRQAMLTTMKQHPQPRDWAAFTLIGEAE